MYCCPDAFSRCCAVAIAVAAAAVVVAAEDDVVALVGCTLLSSQQLLGQGFLGRQLSTKVVLK